MCNLGRNFRHQVVIRFAYLIAVLEKICVAVRGICESILEIIAEEYKTELPVV